MAENWYDRHILPWLTDLVCGLALISRQRARIVPLARGRVLEIGIGSGRNLPFYDPARVRSVVGVDPSPQLSRRGRRRVAQSAITVEPLAACAELLPCAAASFDTIVCTYTLCTIADPAAALAEMARVLVPGGQLLFLEHGRAPDRKVRRWQARLQPWWRRVAGGCHLDRDIPALLAAAGFCSEIEARYLPGPRILCYHYRGIAIPVRASAPARPGRC
ncbi:methyltransferase domain-containing protein [Desulfuromonas carbonis]